MARMVLRRVGEKTEHVVDEAGALFGREGGEGDIVVADKSVSKRHARVKFEKGAWILEDLGSSNGTFFKEERISAPVKLKPRMRFSIAAFTFEVVSQDADGGAPSPARAAESQPTATNLSQPTEAELNDNADEPGDTAPPPAEEANARARVSATHERPVIQKKKAKEAEKPAADEGAEAADDEGGEEAPPPPAMEGDPKSVKFYLAALPRGIAYHMANVPLLLLNPVGTVRKSIQKQPLPELTWPALIVYALPANLFSAAVTFLCTLIMQLVSGTLSIGSIIPVVPLLVAVASSVVGGLICHPVLTWIVDKLKGESNARQRSNYFVLTQSAVALLAIPSGLAILLAAVRVPFIGVLPVLLSFVGTALMTYVAYQWFTAFKVMKQVRIAILVLGALGALGTLKSMIDVIRAGAASVGSSSSSSSSSGDAEEKAEKAKEAAEERAEKAKEAAEEKAEKAKEAAEEKVEKVKEAAEEKAEKAKEAAEEKASRKGKDKKGAEDTKAAAAEEEEKEEKEEKEEAPARGKVKVDYATYIEHRDAMEKALAANPVQLKDTAGLLKLYEKYHRTAQDIRSRGPAPTSKKKGATTPGADLAPVRDRLVDIEVYEKTADMVELLHSKVK